ncbi:uncharacterized protein K02A2.6-like isoform X2 [Uranotaenia lowii]|uniref:uncharacterized protein K02A2.6-like isoform X2 n=1 Tax=Uranotaenia lowii TaxID=190385 RepID=UPI00247AE3BF|nr:uncharacterized protein K02A2.6-like isoform X2 [Uranotaenia lowii]
MIPSSLRNKILKMLHKNHSGMSKIKQMARRTVFWNGINDDIEDFVKACQICHQTTAIRKTVPYSSWQQTNKPFSRLHADFFHFQKKTFLVVVDSHSKWLELEYMRFGTDCRKVLKVFLSIFARFGLPDTIVTDGGPPFNSEYFKVFLEKQGIRVMKSPAYHPESNGQAERMISLGGRILQAHRRQLKILPVSRRGRKLVLHPNNFDRRSNIQQTNITQQHTKRRREDQDDVSSDSDAEGFFGFPADSFLFSEQEALPDLVPMETELEQQVDQEAVPEQRSIRRSTRKPKKRKLCDYVYF